MLEENQAKTEAWDRHAEDHLPGRDSHVNLNTEKWDGKGLDPDYQESAL